jgi:acyl-CoA thioesterase FadM
MLQAHGFSQAEFERHRFGPVMFREEIRYRREIVFGDGLVLGAPLGRATVIHDTAHPVASSIGPP